MHDDLATGRVADPEARGAPIDAPDRGGTQGRRRPFTSQSPARLAPRDAPRSPTRRQTSDDASILLAEAFRPLICEVVREELAKQQPAAPEVFLSTRAAAAVAGVAAGTIRRWVGEGRLTGHHAGRVLRIRRVDLEHLLTATPHRSRVRRADAELTPEQRARRDLGVG